MTARAIFGVIGGPKPPIMEETYFSFKGGKVKCQRY